MKKKLILLLIDVSLLTDHLDGGWRVPFSQSAAGPYLTPTAQPTAAPSSSTTTVYSANVASTEEAPYQ